MESQALVGIGILLVVIGIVLIFLGSLISALQGGEGKAEVGGVVVIGPFPIIFGSSGRAAIIAAVLAVVIIVLMIVFYVLAGRSPPA
ncbi:MAG: DUF131 domain-containing protein [Desulfurococcales archaeon]|nr:DUF131 domain-containing protein [Desulfurococcales archaeon]